MLGSPLTTRELILDTASELIAREGIGKLTLERVAREAGISKGSVSSTTTPAKNS